MGRCRVRRSTISLLRSWPLRATLHRGVNRACPSHHTVPSPPPLLPFAAWVAAKVGQPLTSTSSSWTAVGGSGAKGLARTSSHLAEPGVRPATSAATGALQEDGGAPPGVPGGAADGSVRTVTSAIPAPPGSPAGRAVQRLPEPANDGSGTSTTSPTRTVTRRGSADRSTLMPD